MENFPSTFVGLWTLVKCTVDVDDGRIVYPYGADAIGQLFYDEKGNMMVQIMRRGIEKFTTTSLIQSNAEEVLQAYNGFIAYYGTYRVEANSNHVIHHVTVSSFPNWVGLDQLRYFEFRDNLLFLRTPPIGAERYELVWQKK